MKYLIDISIKKYNPNYTYKDKYLATKNNYIQTPRLFLLENIFLKKYTCIIINKKKESEMNTPQLFIALKKLDLIDILQLFRIQFTNIQIFDLI